MDVTSLPDEMIANYLKFLPVSEIMKLRKMNERISNISKRFKIGKRLPVEILGLHVERSGAEIEVQWPVILIDSLAALNQPISYTLQKRMLGRILEKVEVTYQIEIRRFCFKNTMLTYLENEHREPFRFVTRLEIQDIATKITRKDIARFMNLLPSLSDVVIRGKQAVNFFCANKSLWNRKWSSLSFLGCSQKYRHHHRGLNDDFLMEVAKNCDSFNVELQCAQPSNITISGLLHFIENYILNTERSKTQNWNFAYVKLGEMSISDVERRLDALEGFEVEFTNKVGRVCLSRTVYRHCKIFRCPDIYKPLVSFKLIKATDDID